MLASCSSTAQQVVAPTDLFREIGYEDAIYLSRAETKPLFLFFDNDAAKERQKRALRTLASPKIAPVLRERTVCLRIDIADLPDIAKKYHVTRVPLLILVAPDGHEMSRWSGTPKAETFSKEITTLLSSAPVKAEQHASSESTGHAAQQQPSPEQGQGTEEQ